MKGGREMQEEKLRNPLTGVPYTSSRIQEKLHRFLTKVTNVPEVFHRQAHRTFKVEPLREKSENPLLNVFTIFQDPKRHTHTRTHAHTHILICSCQSYPVSSGKPVFV